jgi:hypothetical protein
MVYNEVDEYQLEENDPMDVSDEIASIFRIEDGGIFFLHF